MKKFINSPLHFIFSLKLLVLLAIFISGMFLISCGSDNSKLKSILYEPAQKPFVKIARAGKPFAQIVLPVNPTNREKYAGTELQSCLYRMSGATLPIIEEGEAVSFNYSFLVGATKRASEAGIKPDEKTMGRDGFTFRSIDKGIIIMGQNDLGTLFGVYELLERYFGVRWFMPGEIGMNIPKFTKLSMGKVDLIFRPSFNVRWVGNSEWSLHQRMNTNVKAGDQPVGVNWKWSFHTFSQLLPADVYFDKHPEWFAMLNGKRQKKAPNWAEPRGPHPCTSNPGVVKTMAENLIKVLEEDSSINIISLGPADHRWYCECPACKALDEPNRDGFGSASRRYFVFCEQVAKIVEKVYPEVKIKLGAYENFTRPPLDTTYKPALNNIIQLCHLWQCHNHPLGSNKCMEGVTYQPANMFLPNQEFERILDQWLKLTPEVYIYEYYSISGMENAKMPWPLIHTIRTDIPFYRNKGIKGFYTQLNNNSWYRQGLNYYLASKLAWNADLNVDAILDDYFQHFYGPASKPMHDYIMAMEESMENWNECASYGLGGVSELAFIGLKVFTPPVMDKMQTSLKEAERLASRDTLLARRVGFTRQAFEDTQQSLVDVAEKAKSRNNK